MDHGMDTSNTDTAATGVPGGAVPDPSPGVVPPSPSPGGGVPGSSPGAGPPSPGSSTSTTSTTSTIIYTPSASENEEDSDSDQGMRNLDFVQLWADYFQAGEFRDWQRLMADLGFPGSFQSRTQCRKALATIWISIPQFLTATTKPEDVIFFTSERALCSYTTKTRTSFPRRAIPSQSPLRQLLAHVRRHSRRRTTTMTTSEAA
ncbi:hypothetical protein ACHAQA_002767 [Verticillium albo-atrum]